MNPYLPERQETDDHLYRQLLGIESCAYLSDGRVFEYYYGIHRSDLSRLHFSFR